VPVGVSTTDDGLAGCGLAGDGGGGPGLGEALEADLHMRAMNILAALGDHHAAAELHGTYTRRLAEAGLDPSDEVRDTAARLCSAIVPGR